MSSALHHLALARHQPEPRQPYDVTYRLAATLPADLLANLAHELERAALLRLRDPAYDPQWCQANPRGAHPDLVALTRSGLPATPAVMAAAAACWAWLAAPQQLDLFAVSTHTQES